VSGSDLRPIGFRMNRRTFFISIAGRCLFERPRRELYAPA
jgi:hypothetical protein